MEAEISVTEAGQAPRPAAGEMTVHVRSLESRLGESLAEAAVTPQSFVEQIRRVAHGVGPGGSTSSVPRSYGPDPVIEEADDV